ncbi:MAG: cyclase family protein [Candidatus Kapaibacteriales bacterium]
MEKLRIDWQHPININIQLQLAQDKTNNDNQPILYGAEKAHYEVYNKDGFIGDTRAGGPCNFGYVNIAPHLNGTHTECAGHITDERRFITDINTSTPSLALLVTVSPVLLMDSGESYSGKFHEEDYVITGRSLKETVDKVINLKRNPPKALIIRTQPNGPEKKQEDYTNKQVPYFTEQAIQFLDTYDFKHLLTDLPSIDRLDDGGKLANHFDYFGCDLDGFCDKEKSKRTITEMIFVPNIVSDGTYCLQMNVAQWQLDAAPSYPVLFPILGEFSKVG